MNYYQITPDIDLNDISSHDEDVNDNQDLQQLQRQLVGVPDTLNNNKNSLEAAAASDDDDPNWLVLPAATKQHRRKKRRQKHLSNGKGQFFS